MKISHLHPIKLKLQLNQGNAVNKYFFATFIRKQNKIHMTMNCSHITNNLPTKPFEFVFTQEQIIDELLKAGWVRFF